MRTKTLALALTLVTIAVAVPLTYAFAHRSYNSTYYSTIGSSTEDEEWWNEMKEHMEERWAGDVDEDWWDEMREHMEERWEELEDGSYRYGGFGGFGACRRWHW